MLTYEELTLIHYLVGATKESETIHISPDVTSALQDLSNNVSLSDPKEVFVQAADLTMLVLKRRPFPTKNTLVAVLAACTMLVMDNYVMHLDWNEVDRVVLLLENGTWSKHKFVEWLEKIDA
jgi:prophage maintenance system killer protein